MFGLDESHNRTRVNRALIAIETRHNASEGSVDVPHGVRSNLQSKLRRFAL